MTAEKPTADARPIRRGFDWLLMIGAIGVMTWSQFEGYVSSHFVMLHNDTLGRKEAVQTSGGADGWTAHPQALFILGFLAIVFATDVHREPLMRSIVWVGAVPLLIACLFPFSFGSATLGIEIGMVAVLISIAAVLMHWLLPDWPFAAPKQKAGGTGTPAP